MPRDTYRELARLYAAGDGDYSNDDAELRRQVHLVDYYVASADIDVEIGAEPRPRALARAGMPSSARHPRGPPAVV